MAGNKNLTAARKAKNDEFYTQKSDVAAELQHYMEHFRGKVVYCNCDDPEESEFWKFFVQMFKSWGLKKLIATHYEPDKENFSYKLEMEGGLSEPELVKTSLPSNGDFRSPACIELLKEADIVVTNPPFSLFREYVAQLMEYGKKFLIIGSMNAITYKEFFPLLQNNQVWLGYGHPKRFRQKDGSLKAFGNIMWFTNLDIPKRHQPLDLSGHRYYGNESKYPVYDNYDAIDCSKVDTIPGDYFKCMGVPITFLDKYCPEQFEILGITLGNTVDYEMTVIYEQAIQHNKDGTVQGGSKVNTRAAIWTPIEPVGTVYYTAKNVNGYLLSVYPRILIRRK